MTTTAALPSPLPARQRLPWPFLAAALVTFAALYISGKFFVVMPVLGVLLVATYLVPFRLPGSAVLGWIVRIVVWITILSISPRRHTTGMSLAYGGSILYEPDYVYLFGYLAAAELVLRLWIASPKGPSRGDALVLAALVFTASSNTTDRLPTQTLAPIYAVLLILCLRSFDRRPGTTSPRPPRPRRLPLLTLRALAGLCAVALAFSAVFVVNRYENDLTTWAMRFTRKMPARQTKIGLSSSPRLSSSFNPNASGERVLLVDGPYAGRRLRSFAFDTYRGGQWSPNLTDRQFDPIPPADLVTRSPGPRLHFTPLVDSFEVLVLPLETAGVRFDGALTRDRFGVLRTQMEPEELVYDAALSKAQGHQGPLCIAPDAAGLRQLLQFPDDVDPRVAVLARDVAGAGPPAARVANIVRHLRANHRYSLTFNVPEDADPVSDFILNHRDAHCQFFAASVVVMARAAGVPARYVNGYYAHEAYGTNQTVVRDRDAHAWAECYVDGAGWVTVDATPDSGLPDQLFPPPSRLQRFWEHVQDVPRNIRSGLSRITLRSAILITGVPIVILLGYWIVQGLRRRRTARPVSREYAAASEQLTAAAAVFDRILASRGHPCVPNRTWREHLSTLPAEAKLDRDRCLQFIRAYDNARFGGASATALAEVRDLLRDLESSGRPTKGPAPVGTNPRED